MSDLKSVSQNGSCKVANCPISSGGDSCLEGFSPPSSCPNFLMRSNVGEKTEGTAENFVRDLGGSEIVNPNFSEDYIDLYTGDGFSPESAVDISSKAFCQMIMLAGLQKSGKTTLLTSIYESFQKGKFASQSFAGSHSLVAWEKRCFLSRLSSGQETPDTERTKVYENSLLHLVVKNNRTNESPKHLLFGDIAGERFRQMKDSVEECRKFEVLKRVDHLTILLDGEKLLSLKERINTITDTRILLRSCLDSEMVTSATYVEIVITKWDLLKDEFLNNVNNIKELLSYSENKFSEEFSERVKKLQFFNVAARPANSDLPFGYNVSDLFLAWISEIPVRKYINGENDRKRHFSREYDMYPIL